MRALDPRVIDAVFTAVEALLPPRPADDHGQLRRNTDRSTVHRLAQLAPAIVLIITAKLIDWHDRWNRP